jgi:hypothetical protein
MRFLIMLGSVMMFAMGCSSSPATLSHDYGTSLYLVKHSQILNPEAPNNLAPVVGIDGRGSIAAYRQYIGSFDKKNEGGDTANLTAEKTIISTMLPIR